MLGVYDRFTNSQPQPGPLFELVYFIETVKYERTLFFGNTDSRVTTVDADSSIYIYIADLYATFLGEFYRVGHKIG